MEINETKQLINALNRLCDNDNKNSYNGKR